MSPQGRPTVVAHRGASHDVAEHTLGAYVAALDRGADGLECDVRLTADGHLVCVHDRDLRRVGGGKAVVSRMELSDLAELDLAAWKKGYWADDEEVPDRDDELDRVLTLRTLLETVRDHDRRIELAIETKHPTRYGGLVERKVAELLREFGWDRAGSPVRLMSFSNSAMQRAQRYLPEIPLVQLTKDAARWPLLRLRVGKHWIMGPGMQLVLDHPDLVGKMIEAGHEVHVWVVNTEADLDLCLALGVTTIITDKPGFIRELVDARVH